MRPPEPGGTQVNVVACPGTWPHHEVPHDYWRFTRYGLELLFAEDFVDVGLRAQGEIWATLGQMLNLELHRRGKWRRLAPWVNRLARKLDRGKCYEELALNWLVTGKRGGYGAP